MGGEGIYLEYRFLGITWIPNFWRSISGMSTFNKILRYTLKSETCHFRLCWFRGSIRGNKNCLKRYTRLHLVQELHISYSWFRRIWKELNVVSGEHTVHWFLIPSPALSEHVLYLSGCTIKIPMSLTPLQQATAADITWVSLVRNNSARFEGEERLDECWACILLGGRRGSKPLPSAAVPAIQHWP